MRSLDAVVASAPNKIIIAGEHSVVYGGLAIASPVEVGGRRNTVRASLASGGSGIVFAGDLGTARLGRDGKKSGAAVYYPYLDGIMATLKLCNIVPDALGGMLECNLDWSGAPKSTGNSASISAATVLSVAGLFKKSVDRRHLFEIVRDVDNVVHGGRGSGVDALTVCSSSPIEFSKKFLQGKPPEFFHRKLQLSLPAKTALVLADSSLDGLTASTAKTTAEFAKTHGVNCPPSDLSASKRRSIISPFDRLEKRIRNELSPKGSPKMLGRCFDENHELLRESGVSSGGIEKVIGIARQAGAIGAKLSGGGGAGGAVLILAMKDDLARIGSELESESVNAFELGFPSAGARIDSSAAQRRRF